MINSPIINKFFKDFTNHRKKTNKAVVCSCRPLPNVLKYCKGTTDEIFQQLGKQNSFMDTFKSSASMYESLGFQFFRTTTGIQSGPDTFDKSRLDDLFNQFWSYINIM